MASYQRVEWHRSMPGDPAVLFSEIGPDGCEVRKVDVFADGRVQRADGVTSTGDIRLSNGRLPSLDEINADPRFSGIAFDAAEFEREWRRAVRFGEHGGGGDV